MNHQDWKDVVVRKPAPKTKPVQKSPNVAHARKLEEETEDFEHEKVSHNLAQTIQQSRAAKGWTRQDLAQRLNVKANVIADYETGQAIPEGKLLQKLSQALGVTLRKHM